MHRFLVLLWFTGGLLVMASCDTAPGPATDPGTPPELSNFSFSPSLIQFETLPQSQREGDSVAVIPLDLRVSVQDADNDIDSVLYIVQSPFDAFSPFDQGRLRRESGFYVTQPTLRIPRGSTGLYTVSVYAVDSQRNLSNQVRGLLNFAILEGGGSPPVIEDIEGPEEITPPTTLTLVAIVSDPDGLQNIQRVVVRTPNGAEQNMFDDGETFDDPVAGDGRYRASFNVDENTPSGTFTFSFQAFDRAGLASDTLFKDVTVN